MRKENVRSYRLYNIWKVMQQRCSNPNNPRYARYGGRGITRCSAWDDWSVFQDWAYANGYEDTLTIERIDNDGSYEPSNCTWIPLGQQTLNRALSRDSKGKYIGV